MEKNNEITESTSANVQVSLKERFAFGMGDFWTSIVYTSMTTYLIMFYTDIVGISAAVIGSIMLIIRFIDAFWDLGVGALVDRTKSKHGKARPWLLWMGIPFGLSLILLFIDPGLGSTGSIIYVFITYLFLNLVYSAVNIPYGALTTLITQNSYNRTVLNMFRMTSAYVGAVILNMVAMPSINSFSNEKMGWLVTFGVIGILIPIGYYFTFKLTKERVKPVVVKSDAKVSLKREFNALVHNKYWVIMVLLSLSVWVSTGIPNGLNAYVAKYVLHDSNLVGAIGIAGLVPLIIGVPLMGPIIKKFGKRNASLAGILLGIPGSLLILIDPTNIYIIYACVVLRALATVPLMAAMNAMLADTIDYGEWKSGIRSEGLVFSASSFGMKVGAGLSSAMVGWFLAFGHYNGKLAEQSASTLSTIVHTYTWIPLILTIIQFILLYAYTLDKKHADIVDELEQVRLMNIKKTS